METGGLKAKRTCENCVFFSLRDEQEDWFGKPWGDCKVNPPESTTSGHGSFEVGTKNVTFAGSFCRFHTTEEEWENK